MKNILNNKKVIIFDLDGVLINSVDFLKNYMKNKYEGMTDEDFKEIFLVNFWDGLNNFKKIAEKNTSYIMKFQKTTELVIMRFFYIKELIN